MKNENAKKSKERRDNGDGNIKLRSDGRYEGRIYDERTGKRISVYGKTETEVRKKLKQKKKDVLLGKKEPSKLRTDEYMSYWLKNYKFNTVKRTTYDKHEQMLRSHIVPNIGFLKIKDVTTNDLQKMFNEISKIRAYSTMKKVYEVVKPCFDHAFIVGDIDRNPILGLKLPRESNMVIKTKKIQIYTDEELELIEQAMYKNYDYNGRKKYRLTPLCILLANTGLRRGEILALKWDDVDLDNQVLEVKHTLGKYKIRDKDDLEYQGKYKVEFMSPKTENSKRIVPLNKRAIAMLNEIRKRNDFEGIKSDYVACSKEGNYLSTRSLDQMFNRICDNCGVEFKGMHALRHSFASKCFAAKIDVKIISEILGHAEVKMTLDTYIHLVDKQKIDAVKELDRI